MRAFMLARDLIYDGRRIRVRFLTEASALAVATLLQICRCQSNRIATGEMKALIVKAENKVIEKHRPE